MISRRVRVAYFSLPYYQHNSRIHFQYVLHVLPPQKHSSYAYAASVSLRLSLYVVTILAIRIDKPPSSYNIVLDAWTAQCASSADWKNHEIFVVYDNMKKQIDVS